MGKGKGKLNNSKSKVLKVAKNKKARRVLIVVSTLSVVISVIGIRKELNKLKILVGEEINYHNRLDQVDTK